MAMGTSAAHQGGKTVGLRLYLHIDALPLADKDVQALVDDAVLRLAADRSSFNVVRIDKGNAIALLEYPFFEELAFPVLSRSWRIDPSTGRTSFRDYRNSLNPPILHRKELLLPPGHCCVSKFSKLTADLEYQGLFDDTLRIGYRRQWDALLRERGYRVVGHDLVPIGNDEDDGDGDITREPLDTSIQRHLTALSRQYLSAPVSAMIRVGLLTEGVSFFDYGCGRGDDVTVLTTAGLKAAGWDPYFAPGNPRETADLVNIGFVINVIEDPTERREALFRAFELARIALCVSAMLATDGEGAGEPYTDGVLTKRKTFQRYYTQTGLRDYIEDTLQTAAVALAPGVFLVFKNTEAERAFVERRLRNPPGIRSFTLSLLNKTSTTPTNTKKAFVRRSIAPKAIRRNVWTLCPDAILSACKTWQELGREPFSDEVDSLPELEAAFGSWSRAIRVIRERVDQEFLNSSREQRKEELLVHFALQCFGRRSRFRELDVRLQRDVKAFFRDYATAMEESVQIFALAADTAQIARACSHAAEQGLGWLVEDQTLLLHSMLVARLPAVLRVYVGCAAVLYGDISGADIVRIHIASGKVTMLRCDDFSLPLPKVIERVTINLRSQGVRVISYGDTEAYMPATLYLKSRFMNEEMPGYAEQVEFDNQISELVKVDEMSRGPDAPQLATALRRAGLKIAGSTILDDDTPPNLDDPCGLHLTYRNLIVCGETALTSSLPNLPRSIQSYLALRELAEKVLDPIIDWFGSIELTYGFCSHDLVKKISGRIAPALDQHSACDPGHRGKLICERRGAAADFFVRDEDMYEVAEWVAANTPFDRLYIYGRDRPIHVSHGPQNKREIYEMIISSGRRVPRKVKGYSVFPVT